jgi:hypothetical protein
MVLISETRIKTLLSLSTVIGSSKIMAVLATILQNFFVRNLQLESGKLDRLSRMNAPDNV